MGNVCHLLDGIDRPKDIADMGNAHKPCVLCKELLVCVQVQHAFFSHRDHLQDNPPALCLQLPWNDVGVVFHRRDNHLIALLHAALCEAGGNEVQALRRPTGKDNLICGMCVDELPYRLTCSLMQVGCLLRQPVYTTVYVGIHIEVFLAHGIQHAERFLRGGTVVKVNQRLAVNSAGENREGIPDFVDIVHIFLYWTCLPY